MGNRESINLWNDKWLVNNQSLSENIAGPLTLAEESLSIKDVLNQSLNTWNLNSLSFDIPNNLKELIHNTYTFINPKTLDKSFWTLSQNEAFSVKSCYKLFTSNSNPETIKKNYF